MAEDEWSDEECTRMKPYYEHAGITIYHGDCREVLPNILRVDLCMTDPPYGISFAAQPTFGQRKAMQQPEQWDNERFTGLGWVKAYGKIQVIWGGNYYELPVSRGWLCWHKPDAPPSMGSFELAWTNQDQNSRHISYSIAATNPERLGHPTQKPEAVILWAMQQIPEWQECIDPFMGSGTTLRAAKDLGRRAIGIEIEEKYCEIAAKRLSQEVFEFK